MIKFGTDGWRGIISDTFTFDNVRRASQGLSQIINKDKSLPKKIAIGYDRRFLSKDFAIEAAKVLAANGIGVLLAEDFLPTPVVSWAAKNIEGLSGAIVITASHNPFCYNGFKFKERYGCSAFPETTKKIEDAIQSIRKKPPGCLDSLETGLKNDQISFFNPVKEYSSWLTKFVNVSSLKNFAGKVLLDPMNGSGSGHVTRILQNLGVDVCEIHANRDPLFRGLNPEPREENLNDTISLFKKTRSAFGIVLDGDSDRIGAIDENGNFFSTQEVYSLIAWHFMSRLNKKGAIGKTVSTTHIIDRLGEKFGVKIIETPIGFKHLAKKMIDGEIFLGGEESGGIGVAEHLPERDPILVSLILLDILANEKKGIREIYNDICRAVGQAVFLRKDYEITSTLRDEINSRLKSKTPTSIDGKKVVKFTDLDGFKFIFGDGGWILIRTSGTEAVLRIYAETQSKESSRKLIHEVEKLLKIK